MKISPAAAQRRNGKLQKTLPGARQALRGGSAAGLLLFLFTICLFAQTDTRAQLREYIETGRYTEAEAAAKKLLLKTPDNGAVRHELADTLALTGRYTEAITEFERAAADSAKADNIGDKLESDLRRAEVLTLIGQEDRAKTINE